jgi:hypothetical protein
MALAAVAKTRLLGHILWELLEKYKCIIGPCPTNAFAGALPGARHRSENRKVPFLGLFPCVYCWSKALLPCGQQVRTREVLGRAGAGDHTEAR